MDDLSRRRVANTMNCQLEELSIRYLGIPLSDSKMDKEELAELPNKVSKRIAPWKGKHM
jgi:hypothetical protein